MGAVIGELHLRIVVLDTALAPYRQIQKDALTVQIDMPCVQQSNGALPPIALGEGRC